MHTVFASGGSRTCRTCSIEPCSIDPPEQEDAPRLKLSQLCRARLINAHISLLWSSRSRSDGAAADNAAFVVVANRQLVAHSAISSVRSILLYHALSAESSASRRVHGISWEAMPWLGLVA